MEFLAKKTSIKMANKLSGSKKKKNKAIKGPWLQKEDMLLKKWVEENGPKNWWACARTIPGRNSRQCNQHWNISLRPNLMVGNWTTKEIFLILVFYKKYNGSWKKMTPIFKSRTENSIKNIFYSQIRKISRLYKNKDYNNENKENDNLDNLLKYYDIALEQFKKKFLKDNPMTENELEEYINNIEIMLENKPNDQIYIDLDKLEKPKNNNIKITNNNKIIILNESDDKKEDGDNYDNDPIDSLNKNSKQKEKQRKSKMIKKTNKKKKVNKNMNIIGEEKTYNEKKTQIAKAQNKKEIFIKEDGINNNKFEEEMKLNNENKSNILEQNKEEFKSQIRSSQKCNSYINKNEDEKEKIIKNEVNYNKIGININNNNDCYSNYNNDPNNYSNIYGNIDYNNITHNNFLNNINNNLSLNKQNNNLFNNNNYNIPKLNGMNFYNSLSNKPRYFLENMIKNGNEIIDNNKKQVELKNSKELFQFSNLIDSNNILNNNNSLNYLKFGALDPNYYFNQGNMNFNNGIMNNYINENINNLFPINQNYNHTQFLNGSINNNYNTINYNILMIPNFTINAYPFRLNM